jgi:hypothetical protein
MYAALSGCHAIVAYIKFINESKIPLASAGRLNLI